jgi:hypothetical protein
VEVKLMLNGWEQWFAQTVEFWFIYPILFMVLPTWEFFCSAIISPIADLTLWFWIPEWLDSVKLQCIAFFVAVSTTVEIIFTYQFYYPMQFTYEWMLKNWNWFYWLDLWYWLEIHHNAVLAFSRVWAVWFQPFEQLTLFLRFVFWDKWWYQAFVNESWWVIKSPRLYEYLRLFSCPYHLSVPFSFNTYQEMLGTRVPAYRRVYDYPLEGYALSIIVKIVDYLATNYYDPSFFYHGYWDYYNDGRYEFYRRTIVRSIWAVREYDWKDFSPEYHAKARYPYKQKQWDAYLRPELTQYTGGYMPVYKLGTMPRYKVLRPLERSALQWWSLPHVQEFLLGNEPGPHLPTYYYGKHIPLRKLNTKFYFGTTHHREWVEARKAKLQQDCWA